MTVTSLKPHIRAVPMNLFPTMNSLNEVIEYADSTLPVASKNMMFVLLMTYHNTLLKVNHEQNQGILPR